MTDLKSEKQKLSDFIKDTVSEATEVAVKDLKEEIKGDFEKYTTAIHTEKRTSKYADWKVGEGKAFSHALQGMLLSVQKHGDMSKFIQDTKNNDDDFYRKFLGEQNANNGGDRVIPRPLASDIIPMLYNRLALTGLGARQMDLPSGRLDIGRQNVRPEAFYKDEGAALTDSQVGFERISLQAKKLTVMVPVSGEFLRRDARVGLDFVMDQMIRTAAQKMDVSCLYGDGTSDDPVGIFNKIKAANKVSYASHGVGALKAKQTNLGNFEAALDLQELTVKDANHAGPYNYLMSDRDHIAMRRYRDSGLAIWPGLADANPSLRGYGVHVSNNVAVNVNRLAGDPDDLDGDESDIFFGDWSSVIVGIASGMQLDVSEHTKFRNDLVEVRLILEHDVELAYDDALYCLSTDFNS